MVAVFWFVLYIAAVLTISVCFWRHTLKARRRERSRANHPTNRSTHPR